ncbi:MAG: ABC transporter permease [Halobacteriales archaeon]
MVNTLYLGKRIVVAVLSVLIVVSVVFGMTEALPGTAANIALGTAQTEEAVQQLEQQMGLNRPLHVRYFEFLVSTVTLSFGDSFISGQPVMNTLAPAVRKTLELALVATFLSIFTAIPLGVMAAAKRRSIFDNLSLNLSYILVSVPSFVSATLLLLVFTQPPLAFFPSGGYEPLSKGVFTWLHHIVLPAVSLNVVIFAYVLRQTRSSMIETLESDYIRTARLKGVGEGKVLMRHALRNGLLPTVTVVAINFGWMMGAVVIVEEIFSYPGVGQLIVRAITSRDLPVLQAAILVPTVAFIAANLLADIIYTIMDPRIGLGEK